MSVIMGVYNPKSREILYRAVNSILKQTFKALEFIIYDDGSDEESAAYILTCAVRECVTNAVRYAGATQLYAEFNETGSESTVTVTNNGRQPDSEIVEGGGLSTLRRRVERAGGTMTVQSRPRFQLTVIVSKEGVL